MEYLKDFDFDLKYHLGKANVVADALSHKVLAQAEVIMHTCKTFRWLKRLRCILVELPKIPSVVGCKNLHENGSDSKLTQNS